MTPTLPREERDAIRARAEAAMPGPWEYEPSTDEILSPDGGIAEMTWPGRTRTSAEFIAHARTDVTALLDALDEAERRIALAHEVGNEVGERCARAEAKAGRTRAERDFEERRADGLAAELAALRGRIEGLHHPDNHGPGRCDDAECFTSCDGCGYDWPCDTARALLADADEGAGR